MKRSSGLRYGTTYHLHLHSKEVKQCRHENHKAYMLWLHLQATTFTGVDSWARSMGAMAKDLNCGASSLRRWAAYLESLGLLRRESGSLSKEEQVWTLLTPPSVRDAQGPAKAVAVDQRKERAEQLRSELASYHHMLRSYYSGDDLSPELVKARDEVLSEVAAMELELESIS